MNKATLILLAVGAAVIFGAKKLLGASPAAPKSLADQGKSLLGSVGNAALGAIPAQYGFKAPAASPLGGNKSASGAGATVDLTQLIKAAGKGIGSLFKSSKGPTSSKEDYLAALAEGGQTVAGPDGSEFYESNGAYFPGNFSSNQDYQAAQTSAEYDAFLANGEGQSALEGCPGRNFSLEDGPLNSTEGPAEINNPFLYDAPGGADYNSFSEPQSQWA